ncbi:hypothetical protein GGR58DRAFT_510424 [Xylaria digitata]|nr:hypothetical protein GGR58DRAFT_510424 [Xylaria digitata]
MPLSIRSSADENNFDHWHQRALSGESQVDVSPLQTPHEPSHDSTNLPRLSWRPFYLRRSVLLGFLSVFIILIATIEALLAISNRDHGLATTTPREHYLWTYGPTALLTGLAALWARTEYRSKLAAPWIHLSQDFAPASHTLLSDYVSQFSLFAIFTSLSKRDFIVSIALTVSIIFKILVIISTGLMSLSSIGVTQNSYPMLLRDEFVDSNAKLESISQLALFIVNEIRNQDFVLPDGISSNYAFQSVDLNLPDAAEVQVTVDGLVNSVKCEPADLALAGAVAPISTPNNNSTLFAKFQQVQCDTIPGDPGKRIVAIFGNITYYTDYSRNISTYTCALGGDVKVNPRVGILNKSASLLCVSEYAIDKVQVTRNATQAKSVLPVPGTPRKTLGSVAAWDLIGAIFIGDSNMLIALTSQLEPEPEAADLFDVGTLQKAITNYYQQLGSITLNENRLVVHSWIAQWMAVLVTVCAILTVIALIIVPSKGFLPCSPTTLQNLISILRHSHELSIQLKHAGASDDKHLVSFFEQSKFQWGRSYDPISNHSQFCIIKNRRLGRFPRTVSKPIYPIILHPACRLVLCLSIIGLIIALELLLYKSDLGNGLGDVDNNTYIQYIWKSIPALLLGTLSVVFSAVDFQIRTLAPYIALRKSIPRTTTMAFLVASLFTAFSASLFQDLSIPITTSLMLQFNNYFIPTRRSNDVSTGFSPCIEIPSLILQGSYSFPRYTYRDLVFPKLTVAATLPSIFDEPIVSVSAVIPAVRPRMKCLSYEPSQIHMNFSGTYAEPLIAWLDGLSSLDNHDFWYRWSSTSSDLMYLWGKIQQGTNFTVQHAAALDCNMTFEALDVDTTFLDTDFNLDSRNPPQPLENTVRTITVDNYKDFDELWDYNWLSAVNVTEILDYFFSLLLTSPWAIPFSALGDPSKNDDVIAATQLHNSIIVAQRIALLFGPASEANSTLAAPFGLGNGDTQRTINSTVTGARRRVVQDGLGELAGQGRNGNEEENEDDVSRFGIFIVDKEKMHQT